MAMRRADRDAVVGTLLLVAVLSLVQPTGSRGLDQVALLGLPLSTLHNIFLLLVGLVAGLTFGVRRRLNPVIAGAFLLLLFSFTLSEPVPLASPTQNVRTFFALSLAPFFFELRLPPWVEGWLRRLLPWMAIGNLVLSLALFLVLERPLHIVQFRAFRLSGTIMPLGLSMLSLVGLLFSLLASRRHPRWIWLAVINFGIVVWTGTRLTGLCGAILCFAWIMSEWLAPDPRSTVRHRLAVAAAVPLVVLSYAPFMAQRLAGAGLGAEEAITLALPFGEEASEEGDDSATTIQLTMTGRLAAWKHYFGLAREALWFGRGLSAGVVGGEGVLNRAFRLPHNEYLRILVSGGVVGLAVMLAAHLWVFGQLLRNASSRSVRILFLAAFAVLVIEAFLTNVLAAQPFMIPFWLYLSILDSEQPAAELA